MSTQTKPKNTWKPAQAAINAKPNILVTGRINNVSNLQTTGGGDGDYQMFDINITPTRGSGPFRARFMFRPEMFSSQFDLAEVYGEVDPMTGLFKASEELNFVPEGKSKTAGQSYAGVYGINISPKYYVAKKDNPATGVRAGETRITQHTALSAIAGGSYESWEAFFDVIGELNDSIPEDREPDELGLVSPTSEEVFECIQKYLQSATQPEQVFELRQQKDQDGELTDYYEMARYHGLLTNDNVKRLREQVAKRSTEPVAKQLAFRCQLPASR